MPRIERDTLNMNIARLIAQRGTCDRGSVGCIITREGRIISTGYNGSPAGTPHCHDEGCMVSYDSEGIIIPGCKRTVHAEAGAIYFASKHGVGLDNSTMYVTISPCFECAKAIISAGITRVFYMEEYRDNSGIKLLESAGVKVIRHNK